jgi:hypothetical protein
MGARPRERPSRDEKPAANDGATQRRKRVWRTGTAEEAVQSEAPRATLSHQVEHELL